MRSGKEIEVGWKWVGEAVGGGFGREEGREGREAEGSGPSTGGL